MALWGNRLQKQIKWPFGRMEFKLSIVFLVLILLPMGGLSYLSSERYQRSIENNTVTYVSQVSDMMISKLDDYTEDMKKISIIPSYVDNIIDNLKLSNDYYEKAADPEADVNEPTSFSRNAEDYALVGIGEKIRDSIYFLNTIKQGTNTIYLFDNYGHPYSVVRGGGVRSDLYDAYPKWKELASKAHGRPVLVSTQEVAGPNRSEQFVFTVVRAIIGPSYEQIGMFAVDANISVIAKFVEDLDRDTRGTTLIVDDAGAVVFDSEKKYLGQVLKENELLEKATGLEGSFHGELNGEPVLTIYRQSSVTGWKILITIPEHELTKEALKTRKITELTAILIIGFALIISLVLIFTLTRPLRRLVRLMKQVQNGNLDVVFPVRGQDEIGMVGNAFNRMIMRVKTSMEDVAIAAHRTRVAEIEALQQQINPHFIYNTLEAMRMTAVMNDDAEVSDMALILGKLLRYSIGSGMETVTLKKELEHLDMYVQLLNFRYAEPFRLIYPEQSLDEEMPMMKLLFQPIVENSVYHGLDESKQGMDIRIAYEMKGPDHIFTIEDNGKGMSEDVLQRLRSQLDGPAQPGQERGIGLRNVNERLKLRYGEAYGISVDSRQGNGTKVTIRIPLR